MSDITHVRLKLEVYNDVDEEDFDDDETQEMIEAELNWIDFEDSFDPR